MLVDIKTLIETHFNLSELKDLCFELNIDFENIPGEAKNAKIRGLLIYCFQHNKTTDLFAYLEKSRSTVRWPAPDTFSNYLALSIPEPYIQSLSDQSNSNYITLLTKPLEEEIEPIICLDIPEVDDRIVLVGDGGSGKTTTLKQIAYRQTIKFLDNPDESKLPVYIHMSETSDLSMPELLKQAVELAEIDAVTFEILLQNGRFLFLIDALNEIPEDIRRKRINELRSLIHNYSYNENGFIVTTRPSIFQHDLNLNVYQILPLTKQQILAFVQENLEDSPDKIDRFLQSVDFHDAIAWSDPGSLTSLCRNPLMLAWMLELREEIPKSRGLLIRSLVKKRLWKWEEKTGKRKRYRYSQKKPVLKKLAYEMIKDERVTTSISWEAAERIFFDHTHDYEHATEMLKEVIANGILLEAGDGETIMWIHQLVQEYFGAEALKDQIFDSKDVSRLVKNIEWHEPLVMLAGLLADDEEQEFYFEKLLSVDPFLAARCFSYSPTLTQNTEKRSQIVTLLEEKRTNLWALTGDVIRIEEIVREEIRVRKTNSASIFQLLAKLLETQGRWVESLEILEAASSISNQKIEDRFEQLCDTGNLYRRRGLHEKALKLFNDAEELGRASNYIERNGRLYYEIAYIHEKEGRVLDAIKYYNLSYKAEIAVNNVPSAYIAKAQVGFILIRSGRLIIGCNLLENSRKIFVEYNKKDTRNERWIYNIDTYLLEAYIKQKNFKAAEKSLEKCTRSHRATESLIVQYKHLYMIGKLLLAKEKYQEAFGALLEAYQISRDVEKLSQERIAGILHHLGLACLNMNQLENAVEYFEKSIKEPINLNNARGHADSCLELAHIFHERGQLSKAKSYLKESIIILRQLHSCRLSEAVNLLQELDKAA